MLGSGDWTGWQAYGSAFSTLNLSVNSTCLNTCVIWEDSIHRGFTELVFSMRTKLIAIQLEECWMTMILWWCFVKLSICISGYNLGTWMVLVFKREDYNLGLLGTCKV